MSLWLVVVLAAAGTLALRLSFLFAGRYLRLPSWARRTTDLVFPVAIAGILGASLRTTAVGRPAELVVLVAGAATTVLVSRRTGSVLAALGAGLAAVFVATAITGLIG